MMQKLFLAVLSLFFLSCSLKNSTSSSLTKSQNDFWIGEAYSGFSNRKTVTAKNYMISTADELSSHAGEEMLARGGNAIDAAIAAQMVLNVVEPQSSGIGGGAFLLYFDNKTKKTIAFNGRETAPINSNSKIFLDVNGQPKKFYDVVQGGLSVGTPGALKMLKEVHSKYGKLPWKDLFAPAIKIADEGFKMDQKIYVIASNFSYLSKSENFAKLYLQENGKPKAVGTIIKNPELAETFRTIASKGIKPFYQGKIARDIVDVVKNSKTNPGYLSLDDLKNYRTKKSNLICGTYRIYKVCSMPLPSSGGITILATLGILENFDLAKLKPLSIESVHLISEASRLAYADRNEYIGDVKGIPIKQMLDKKYLKQRAELISPDHAMLKVEPGIFTKNLVNKTNEKPSTTHISIVDKYGNAISMTSSIEYLFGSTLMVDGFMLNNQLTDFSFVPEIDGKKVANRLEPRKQPRSSMSPVFVFDKKDNLIMVVGSPGGPRIIQYVLKTIIAHLDWNLDIQQSISLPNHVVLNDQIELENHTKLTKLKSALKKMGHKVINADITSGIHGVTINDNRLEGGADPRRHGVAIGN